MKYGFLRWVSLAVVAAGLLSWMAVAVAAQQGVDWPARVQEEAAKPTPRTADGKPNLTGHWVSQQGGGLVQGYVQEGNTLVVLDSDAPEIDTRAQVNFKSRAAARASANSPGPSYKPEFVVRHRELMHNGSVLDPGIHCYPRGVPRLGSPSEIVQTPETVYFLYSGRRAHRIIPIGGQHDEDRDPFPEGDAIAWWDGDTLVVETVNIDPYTWLSADGDFHSDEMRVTERLTRKGNTLEYDVTIDDPQIYTEPWKPVAGRVAFDPIGSRTGDRALILSEGTHASPAYPCVERDRANKVNLDRF